MHIDSNRALANIVRRTRESLTFTIVEIGALPRGKSERFHSLLSSFPGSRIYAFEVDEALCNQLNRSAPDGLRYYPIPLGRREEKRTFYETVGPVCSSLYKPNEEFTSRYVCMEGAAVKSVCSVQTASLDYFAGEHDIGPVDFMKLDIQGAELEVFQGGTAVLEDVSAMVCEVMFVSHYERQPLFGETCEYLTKRGFLFHKFLGMGGRTLKPFMINNDPNFATQHIWSDAVFLRDPARPDDLTSEQLLKIAIIAHMYGSFDVTGYCFLEYDKRHGTDIAQEMLAWVNVTFEN